MMLLPERAPVRPRVFTPVSGEVLPLEDEIRALVAAGHIGLVDVIGPAGSGKTTALRHLVAVLPADAPVVLLDESDPIDCDLAAAERLVVRATAASREGPPHMTYRLAPWDHDDLIEYLLAVHREHCGRVVARLGGAARLQGNPELWRIALDQLASDPTIADARAALVRYLHNRLADTDLVERARSACLNALSNTDPSKSAAEWFGPPEFAREVFHVLRHPQMQLLLAAERVAADLRSQADCDFLALRLPRDLVQAAAEDIVADERAIRHLHKLIAGPPWSHAMAASLLHRADAGWKPDVGRVPVLTGAYLENAAWAKVWLRRANLRDADLSHADLRAANLASADAFRATLCHCRLTEASLDRFNAAEADLTGADLARVRGEKTRWDGANLEGANFTAAVLPGASFQGTNLTASSFVNASLAGATFTDVELEGADFSGAGLRNACLAKLKLRDATFAGARFAGANLSGCDMEGMELAGCDFQSANLEGALLTETNLRRADLQNACLRQAGLGDINLERADLRNADLRDATFHMGSTRSGLLFTPIASEGTRTGFYTDDADEQNFKAPEEIRKANLCGADLRGARIDDVDFYLVDLRGARYDRHQELHFRRCRAILESRVDGMA